MLYQSTRNKDVKITAAEAIARGLSPDGGLFVPESFQKLIDYFPPGNTEINLLRSQDYQGRAANILRMFLEEFDSDELYGFAKKAYCAPGFDHPDIAPVRKLDGTTHFLELWHGPTCAFKDMALQMLPRLLSASLKKIGESRGVCILVATSGDTGKAALEGFADVEGTRIMVFYPRDGVSDVQKLQMTTQSGDNVNVVAVEGNFDDAQTGVKAIFSDSEFAEELSGNGYFLSSANSINWGRLVPQIVYYISAYCDLVNSGDLNAGDEVNFCVPTGNFGNILAGYYAKKMGLPVRKLICASNRNDVLADFVKTGIYDKNRPFYTTVSPSMDILISSNLERLLFDLSDCDSVLISQYMSKLASGGRYEVGDTIKERVKRDFYGGFCSEEDTKRTIRELFEKYGYLVDTHTAVAYKVLGDYRTETGDNTPAVVVSTASPFKFCDSVLDALGKDADGDGLKLLDRLTDVTGCKTPAPLGGLAGKKARFNEAVSKDGMKDAVRSFLE